MLLAGATTIALILIVGGPLFLGLCAGSVRSLFYPPPFTRMVKHHWFAWHPIYADMDGRGYRWVWRRRVIRQAYRESMEWRYRYWPYTRHPPWDHNPGRNP